MQAFGGSRFTRGSALVLALAVLATAACGLGEKQNQAERIHLSRARAVAAGAAQGTVRFELVPPENPSADNEQLAQLAGAEPSGPTVGTYLVDFDFASQRAQLAEVTDSPEPPPVVALFHGDTAFVRRVNLRPSERRVWAKLDFRRLPDDERRPPVPEEQLFQALMLTVHAVNPVHLVDLAGGALAGSVKVKGREDVAGVSTTRYDVNMSLDRAIQELDLDDDALVTRQLMFRLLLGANDDVRPARFWIDDEGLLRKARLELKQRVTRRESNKLTITIEIPQYGNETVIPTPTAEETIEVDRFGRLVRAAIPRSAQ